MREKNLILAALILALGPFLAAGGEEDLRSEVSALRRELDEFKKERAFYKTQHGQISSGTAEKVEKLVENKYGPNATVTTKQGRLTISGLLQVWFYSIQNDNQGLFGDLTPGLPAGGDSNETRDNDSFRVRRAELKFNLDLNENISAVILIDPSREALSFPGMNSNLGTALRGRANETSAATTNVQTGVGGAAPGVAFPARSFASERSFTPSW